MAESSAMIILPAIDLKDGRCVRLRQGRADTATVYSEDPVAMARHWEQAGARYLHVVDLDGAFQGTPVHRELIGRMVAAVGIPVQMGGGLRRDVDVETMLALGVARVVLGTRVWERPEELADLVARFGARIAVGIDARNGKVQVRGWQETTDRDAVELAQAAAAAGVQTLVYTDTVTDGMMVGPNLEAIESVCRAVSCAVIASGGIASAEDVRRLRELGLPNLRGVIVGRALYDQRVTLEELHRAAAAEGDSPGACAGCGVTP